MISISHWGLIDLSSLPPSGFNETIRWLMAARKAGKLE